MQSLVLLLSSFCLISGADNPTVGGVSKGKSMYAFPALMLKMAGMEKLIIIFLLVWMDNLPS